MPGIRVWFDLADYLFQGTMEDIYIYTFSVYGHYRPGKTPFPKISQ